MRVDDVKHEAREAGRTSGNLCIKKHFDLANTRGNGHVNWPWGLGFGVSKTVKETMQKTPTGVIHKN